MSKLGTYTPPLLNSIVTDAGTATVGPTGIFQIRGGSNINTAGAGSVVTINLNTSVSIAGTLTAGTGVTATTGDMTITAGNIFIPATTADGLQGIIKFGGVNTFHNYGNSNTFVGANSGNLTLTVATAIQNTGFGVNSQQSLTTGNNNSSIGYNSLVACTTSANNVAAGSGALSAQTTGTGQNVAVGYNSLNLCTGNGNTALGALSGAALVGGSSNCLIGYNAGSAYTAAESSNICIGNVGVAGESNTIRIGTDGSGVGQQNTCFFSGIFGATVAGGSAAVLMDSTFKLGTVVSSRRFKDNIQDMGAESSPIMTMRPVTFTLKSDETHTKQFGWIAEEVAPLIPEMVIFDKEGLPYSVRYHDFPILLLNEFQKQTTQLNTLLQEVQRLEGIAERVA